MTITKKFHLDMDRSFITKYRKKMRALQVRSIIPTKLSLFHIKITWHQKWIHLLGINMINGIKFSIMGQNPIFMEERGKVQVLITMTMILLLIQQWNLHLRTHYLRMIEDCLNWKKINHQVHWVINLIWLILRRGMAVLRCLKLAEIFTLLNIIHYINN